MLKKKDLDRLLTLMRKWHKEKDPNLGLMYYEQVVSLSKEIAKGTKFEHWDRSAGNHIFYLAKLIAEKRWPNEQLYIMVERAGEQVDHWEYKGHSI